ncbi:DNA ligase I [Anopheles sinensis]|uniref:DNA ligase I n=1 Tax=Anopheles sinensis TaxID=74873 RepID=A0A084VB90_ANOSI|nr:DNA ligase I [Anopheles sinensis]
MENATLEELKRRLPRFTVTIVSPENELNDNSWELSPPGPQPNNQVCTVPSVAEVSRSASLGPHPPSPTPTPTPAAQCLHQNESAAVPHQALTVPAQVAHQLERLNDESARMRVSLEIAVDRLTVDCSAFQEFDFVPLETREELEKINTQLGRRRHDRSTEEGNRELPCENSHRAMHRFPLQPTTVCGVQLDGGWKTGPKIPFCLLKNVLRLLRRVAGTPGTPARADFIENLVQSRLHTSQRRLQGTKGVLPHEGSRLHICECRTSATYIGAMCGISSTLTIKDQRTAPLLSLIGMPS